MASPPELCCECLPVKRVALIFLLGYESGRLAVTEAKDYRGGGVATEMA